MSALVYPPASNLATSHSRGVSGGDGSTPGVNVARSSGVSEHQPRDARLLPSALQSLLDAVGRFTHELTGKLTTLLLDESLHVRCV